MKGALGPLVFSLLLLLQAGGCQEVKVKAAVGETVQLQPKTWPSSWVAINWKVKLRLEGYWILRHDQNRTSANPLLTFADRVSFHPGNLSLQINSVTEKESGLYTMDVKLGDGSGITQPLSLGLLLPDRVQQPNIKASTSQERGRCYLTLSCLVPKADWVTYSWSRGISSHPAPEDYWLQEHQADLQLEITKSSSNTFYHCNVSNAISWGMATIDVEPLCNYTGWSGAGTDAPTTEVVRTPEVAPTELVGTPGETVTFPLEIPAGETLDTAAWMIGTESLATVIPGDPPSVVVSDRSYRGRLRVPNDGLSLHITDLRLEDAGSYTAQVNTDKSQFTRLFTLHIYVSATMPAQASSLSYCQAKGLILLLVLGVLITGTVGVHIMASKPPKQD
ncbi:T-lymphocyte surface antigen Ly-9-like isoform X2 [Alligator sinensis]|uniref:T-lymphocyte surface antigen Ly-9-like isoform X2 n=1 Tax=Alligator sinensis TaxID=38654 RepID=A0A3Q0FVN6_ALLSI|nr:T-lymphocyte surface antigen Ly-9-like isoform X2 [Alligator sinensis]